jgi:hypothetical protein
VAFRLAPTQLTDDKITPKGKYLLAELIVDHHQNDLPVIPAGTRFLAESGQPGSRSSIGSFCFEASIDEPRVWIEGHIRIVPFTSYRVLGRVTPKADPSCRCPKSPKLRRFGSIYVPVE